MKLLATMALLAILVVSTKAQAGKEWLRPGGFYADTKANMEELYSLLLENDQKAVIKMAEKERVAAIDKWRLITIIDLNLFSLNGPISFRFRGDPQIYWTKHRFVHMIDANGKTVE